MNNQPSKPDSVITQNTTVWSFPQRGNWLTHKPDYRGNWAPQIPENLILNYTDKGDIVLDPMCGGGTTLVEAKRLLRKGIGLDINKKAVELTKKACNFTAPLSHDPIIMQLNAKKIDVILDNSIDLIATHPPYLNIIKYSDGLVKGDISHIGSVDTFCNEIELIAQECYRTLKHNKYCAILIGDTRRRRHYIPLSYHVMNRFLKVGFILKEDIIKLQHNCKTTNYWKAKAKDFFLIMHEHLFIFRKPDKKENTLMYKYSSFVPS